MVFHRLAGRTAKEIARDPLTVALGLAMPLGLLALFVNIGRRAPLEVFTVGRLSPAIAAFSFAFLIMFSGILLARDRQGSFFARLLTTPLSPAGFILAYLLPFLPLALAQAAACYLLGMALGLEAGLGLLASGLALLPLALFSVSFGLLLGSLCTESQIQGIGSVAITAIGLFSGAWMDLRMMGGVVEAVGTALPFSHAIEAAAALAGGASPAGLAGKLALVWAWGLGTAAASVAVFAWKARRD